MVLLIVSILCFILETVLAQQPIVASTQNYIGDTFNITCDVRKFAGLTVVAGQDYLLGLSLWRQTFTQSTEAVLIAGYTPFLPNKITNKLPSQWLFQYSGGESSTNRQTIQIIVTAVNFLCSDAGTYKCRASLPTEELVFSNPINITARAPVYQYQITMSPHNGNDEYSSINSVEENITLTCSASGSSSLQLFWSYTVQDAAVEQTPSGQISNITPPSDASATTSSCTPRIFTSVLEFQLQETNQNSTYYCIVSDNGVEKSRKNFTIYIDPVLSSQTTDTSSRPTEMPNPSYNNSSSDTSSRPTDMPNPSYNNSSSCTSRTIAPTCLLACVSLVMRLPSFDFIY